MGTPSTLVAALEQLPADERGYRRVLRLHAVLLVADGTSRPSGTALCGYRHRRSELRPDRRWETVTASGRCALCELQVRRASGEVVDLRDRPGADVAATRSERR